MDSNNKGIASLFNIMLAVVIIILAIALVGSVRESMDISRNVSLGNNETGADQMGLDCVNSAGQKNTTLSNIGRATCIATDLMTPLFFYVLIGIGGAILIAKIVLQ